MALAPTQQQMWRQHQAGTAGSPVGGKDLVHILDQQALGLGLRAGELTSWAGCTPAVPAISAVCGHTPDAGSMGLTHDSSQHTA